MTEKMPTHPKTNPPIDLYTLQGQEEVGNVMCEWVTFVPLQGWVPGQLTATVTVFPTSLGWD